MNGAQASGQAMTAGLVAVQHGLWGLGCCRLLLLLLTLLLTLLVLQPMMARQWSLS